METNHQQKKVEIFDSTLRDGAQAEGIAFSVEDKLRIIEALDQIGVDYIEAGNPGSNPKDMEFFARAAAMDLQHGRLVAFGSTRHKNIKPEEDKNLAAILSAGTKAAAIFGKCWDLHVLQILGTTLEENLRMIEESCAFLQAAGREVIFDAEHFFDGYKHNPSYAMEALGAAVQGGAECLALCDTNGGCFPHEISEIVKVVCETFPGVRVGIHCHNDIGCAVADSVAAVLAGAVQVQGTYLGFGERCGNANLSTLIPDLQLKLGYTCIPEENMHMLTSAALRVAEIANTSVKRNEPYVGRSAFAHKAGMHADGVLKCSQSFEHINPEVVGNERRFLMSEMTGRTAVLRKIHRVAPNLRRDAPETFAIINELKRLEQVGYQFEGADGSFELLVRRQLGLFKSSFHLVSYKVLDELPYDESHSATATIKVRVGDRLQISAAEGDGPVNALDTALREALCVFYPCLHKVRLIDYKVRVMEPKDATAATVRVLITSTDGDEVWSTVGVSSDVIEASWFALVDSIEYRLRNESHPDALEAAQ